MHALGKIFAALASLAVASAPAAAANAASRPGAARAPALAKAPPENARASALKPVTWGMARPSSRHATRQQLALAVLHPASGAKAALRPDSAAPADIVIDVLVAYTRNAARHYYEIERDVIDPAIEEANRSFRLSGIGHIRLRLARTFQTDYAEQGGHFDHVWHMADKGDRHMEHIHALREAYRADVAILIVDDAKGCGLATRIGAEAEDAFAVVHHQCAAANYTLAHEIGHLIGARHELGYVSGTSWRDIMGYEEDCGGCPRLPVWSNPLVTIAGEPAGTAELNNARIIAENAARVASFR
jgi:hypothetical protein